MMKTQCAVLVALSMASIAVITAPVPGTDGGSERDSMVAECLNFRAKWDCELIGCRSFLALTTGAHTHNSGATIPR